MPVKLYADLESRKAIASVLQPVLDHPAFKAARGVARQGVARVTVSGVSRSAKALVIAGLAHELHTLGLVGAPGRKQFARPVVVITADNEAAERLAESTSTFLEWLEGGEAASRAGVLPTFDGSPYEERSPHPEIAERRAVALWRLACGQTDLLFVPLPAALGRFRSRAFYGSLALEIKAGEEISLDDLVEHLATVGYEPREPVSEVGQYSVRGGIVDVFPPQSPNPLRIEFFGDQIESLRQFDPSSQRSQKSTASALLLPLSESARTSRFFSKLVGILAERTAVSSQRQPGQGGQSGESIEQPEAVSHGHETLPASAPSENATARPLVAGREPDWAAGYSSAFPGWEFFVPLVEPHPNTLFSLLAEAGRRSYDRRESPHAHPSSMRVGNSPSPAANLGQAEQAEAQALAMSPLVIWDEELERTRELKQLLETWAASFEEMRDIVPPRPRPWEVFLREPEFLKELAGSAQINLKELSLEGRQPSFESPSVVPGDSSVEEPRVAGPVPARISSAEHSPPAAHHAVDPNPPTSTHSLATDTGNATSAEFTLLTHPAPKFHGAVKLFIEDLRRRQAQGERVIFIMPTAGKADRLREILKQYTIPFGSASDAVAELGAKDSGLRAPQPQFTTADSEGRTPEADFPIPVLIARGRIGEGVIFPEPHLSLLSDADLFGEFDWGASGRRERSAAATFISDLSDLKVGDYVVHVDHGIGHYQGLRQLGVDGAERDFMLIIYQEDARLYVPLERLDLVEKYRSAEGGKPVLDRLGGIAWARTKARVKRALRDMAQELLQLYAERKMKGGTAYSADTPWQKEFESAFEFQETPDQLSALTEIKDDLESPRPMDRLLCGDVGYGKTELAMRAAFKVVQDGKQVAVLAPTTVLAFQHFNTFKNRMAAFPVRIEMVSRFRTAAEQKKVLHETEAGSVDILIGTHRLLSKDVAFRDLGLLIVDEEQRFGVAAKERLKKLKVGVEVLTMSATPIPRTLNMSLGGLRDLSVIETPPRGRLAIQTVVAPFGPGIIQSGILQEMERQGQVYFVHNRVESIFTMAETLQKLAPTARLGVAHGQMGERELEKVMLKFIQGEYDVLVSTVLIENGLDIPRANTLVVNHAERFGLADLYQLRGRVGRSNRRAYAFFLIPAEETLTPIAKRRLAALKEFSDLGAGFRLAALDLELRGAGNLLGAEQHGHLNSVGLDLYLKMLEQTVYELKGGATKPEVRTTLSLGLDIKIPERYIAEERQRLRMYKRISSLTTSHQRAELEAELIDRYGAIPASVANLFDYAELKSVAERLLVESIERKGEEVVLRFHAQAPVDPERLKQFVRRHREANFRPDGVLRFRLAEPDGTLTAQVRGVLEGLYSVKSPAAETSVGQPPPQ